MAPGSSTPRFDRVSVKGKVLPRGLLAALRGLTKYSPDEPRDERGRWTTGGGGLGPEYSSDSHLGADGKIYTDNVEDAARALGEGRQVVLNQPREVSILLDRLAAIARDAEASGQKAPIYNLCNVTVAGTNLFCVDNQGIPRIQMPQLKGVPEAGSWAALNLKPDVRGEVDLTNSFVDYLRQQGYGIDSETESASYLRATQNELNGAKVGAIMGYIRNGSYDETPLVVSRDNYIVDGHHRWAALVGVDFADNKPGDIKVPVDRVNIDITTLLKEATDFTTQRGLPPVGVGKRRCGCNGVTKYDPNELRDKAGRWMVGYSSFTTQDAARAASEKMQPRNLSGKAKAALKMYTDKLWETLNPRLRAGLHASDASLAALDSAFAKASLPEDLVVYRGVSKEGWGKVKSLTKGSTFTDPAFVSTSLLKGIAATVVDNSFVMEMLLPMGSKALVLGSISAHPEEAEVLVNRGSTFKVLSKSPGKVTVRLD